MGADQSDAVAAVRLIDGGPRERQQRGRIGDDALLDRGFEPAGKRKTTDRQHGIAELQQARQVRASDGLRGAVIGDHHFPGSASVCEWTRALTGARPCTRPDSGSTAT